MYNRVYISPAKLKCDVSFYFYLPTTEKHSQLIYFIKSNPHRRSTSLQYTPGEKKLDNIPYETTANCKKRLWLKLCSRILGIVSLFTQHYQLFVRIFFHDRHGQDSLIVISTRCGSDTKLVCTARALHVTCYCTFLCHISPP
jgi:hypothetical protein